MTNRSATVVLLGLVVVGLSGLLAGPGTTATFSDAHDGTGNATADSNFAGGGGGGGGLQADAGGPYTVQEGGTFTLDPSGSSGPIQEYEWSIISGPGGGWYFPSSGFGQFEAPDNVDGDSQTILELTVTGPGGQTDTDTVVVAITDTDGSGNSMSVGSMSTGSPGPPLEGNGTRQTFGNVRGS